MLRSLLTKLNDEVQKTSYICKYLILRLKQYLHIGTQKVSGSYHKPYRNNLNLNLPRAKIPPFLPGLIGLTLSFFIALLRHIDDHKIRGNKTMQDITNQYKVYVKHRR